MFPHITNPAKMSFIHTIRNIHPAIWFGTIGLYQLGTCLWAKHSAESIPLLSVLPTPIGIGAITTFCIDSEMGYNKNFYSGLIFGLECVMLASTFNVRFAKTKMVGTICNHRALSCLGAVTLVLIPQVADRLFPGFKFPA